MLSSVMVWCPKCPILPEFNIVWIFLIGKFQTISFSGKIGHFGHETKPDDSITKTLFSFRTYLRVYWWYKRAWRWCKNVEHENVIFWCLLLWACAKHQFLMFITRRKNWKHQFLLTSAFETWKHQFFDVFYTPTSKRVFCLLLVADL